MAAAPIITAQHIEGRTYYGATRAGVSYVCQDMGAHGWFVSSRRLALGRFNTGSGRYYPSLGELAASCKAFAHLPALIETPTT